MKSNTEIIVRYAETDQMGIVHHSNYAIWFEAARTDLIRQMGMSYSEMEQRGVWVPLLELECKYVNAAKYEDVLNIEAWACRMKGAKIEFCYRVTRKADGVLISTGRTIHGLVDPQLRPIRMKRDQPEIYEMMLQAIENEEQNVSK